MFNHNPWVIYAAVVGPILTVYYLFVILRYYRQDLADVFRGKQPHSDKAYTRADFADPSLDHWPELFQDPISLAPSKEAPTVRPSRTGLSFDLEKLTEHLKSSVEEAYLKQYDKEDLILLLNLTLKDYSVLIGTPLQASVNELIDEECAKYGSINLSEGDKMMVWKQVD